MSSAISSLGTSTPTTSSSNPVNGMNASDFLNLMIQQLQQQDPLNPTDSNQLLTQMSQIGQLQSNTQLQQTLTQFGLQQAIGSSGNLIGKTVNGLNTSGQSVQGIVTSIKVVNQNVNLELDSGKELPMSNVIGVSSSGATNLAAAAPQISNFASLIANNPTLSSILSSSGGSNLSNVNSLASLLSTLTGK